MRGKGEHPVTLYEFGPDRFYQWLISEGFDNLSCQSEQAIRLLIRDYPGYDNKQTDVKSITHILEYEKLIIALTEEDFINYIEWAIGKIEDKYGFPYPPGLGELVCTPEEIRHRLLLAFSSKRILPSLDFSTLLKNALEAIDAVCNALTEFGPATCTIYKENLQNKIHEGIDKAFLYFENYIDLLLEFLVLAAEECHIINKSERTDLLFLNPGDRPDWGNKQQSLRDIYRKLMQNDYDNILDKTLVDIFTISCPPRPSKRNKKEMDSIQDKPGSLGLIINQLRILRNKVRHAQLTGDYTVPISYKDTAFDVKKLFEKAWDITSGDPFPVVMRMVGHSNNYYDKFEANFISKDAKTITIRFMDRGKTIINEPKNCLVFTKEEPEFFICPRPKLGQVTIVDPFVVKRKGSAYEVPKIYLKFENINDFYESPYAMV